MRKKAYFAPTVELCHGTAGPCQPVLSLWLTCRMQPACPPRGHAAWAAVTRASGNNVDLLAPDTVALRWSEQPPAHATACYSGSATVFFSEALNLLSNSIFFFLLKQKLALRKKILRSK